MTRLIYIDANIYLRFFDNNAKEFKKLLKSIEEVKDSIFVTKQIQAEVERNKLDIFIRSFNGYENQFSLAHIKLPEHFDADYDEKSKQWNEDFEKIMGTVKTQKEKLREISDGLITRISSNEDDVSKVLSKVFEHGENHNEDQIKRARERKELGNPPGKREDPLGDQLSWEQLLDKIPEVAELWIITNDRDYCYTHKKTSRLNLMLVNDLERKNKSLNFYCFNTLSEALRDYNGARKIKNLPKGKHLEKITEEEKKSNFVDSDITINDLLNQPNPSQYALFHNRKLNSGLNVFGNTVICPFCTNSFYGQQTLHMTKDGSYTMGYFCPNCGSSFG